MNISLLAPFESDIPEFVEGLLTLNEYALTVRFNKRGNLLAVGCLDGKAAICDFETRSVAAVLEGHSSEVICLSWSRDSRHLLTASKDGSCILWDMENCEKLKEYFWESAILSAEIHPKKDNLIVICPQTGPSILLDIYTDVKVIMPLVMTEEEKEKIELYKDDLSNKVSVSRLGKGDLRGENTFVCFGRKGDKIFLGTAKGNIGIIETESQKLLTIIKVTGMGIIKSIRFSRRQRDMAVTSSDRIIRVYRFNDLDEPILIHKFQDLVNRFQWTQSIFSTDGSYIVAGPSVKNEQDVYIWNKDTGGLVKILNGPKEGLADIVWHPYRPIIASVSAYGNVYIWNCNRRENWSAFAPDFRELDDNVEYQEREDEFDVKKDGEIPLVPIVKSDDEIDITTIEKIDPFDDSDDEGIDAQDTFYMPVYPEQDLQVEPIENDRLDLVSLDRLLENKPERKGRKLDIIEHDRRVRKFKK